jgi:hypothetical protein
MATTTNYGWDTPDDTDLVKDGAAAIRTLGSSVDTTTKALNPSTTLGDIEYRSATANTNTRLGIGTNGQYLSVTGGVPAWSTISAGGMTLISETVASAISSLSFSAIPGTYKELYLVWDGIVHSTTGSEFQIRLNNDASSNIYSKNAFGIKNNSSADSANSLGESIGSGFQSAFGVDCNSASTQQNCSGWLRLDNYASTTKYKGVKYTSMYYDNAGTTGINGFSNNAVWQSTAAVTSIDVIRASGAATFSNSANTSIRLYGIS